MRSIKIQLLGCLLASSHYFFAPHTAYAQDRQAAPRKVAFLVGVTVFDHSELPKLNFPENDVIELGRVLNQQGYEVITLSESFGGKSAALAPTSANIRKQLARVLKKLTSSDLIIVGLAGHGLQFMDESYFCPRDAVPTTRTVAKKEELYDPDSLIRISEILESLRGSNVGDKLIFVDACRIEPVSGKTRAGVSGVGQIKLPPQTGVLFSCGDGQFAFESDRLDSGHGVFFYHVIQGMKRAAADSDGEVTWGNLTSYVQKNVPKTVKKLFPGAGALQSPHAKTEMEGEQSVIARIDLLSNGTETKVKRPSFTVLPQPLRAPVDRMTIEEVQIQWAEQLGLGTKRFVENSIKMKLAVIPPGHFDNSPGVEDHFFIAATEVSREQWIAVMGAESCPWGRDDGSEVNARLPANYLSYDLAKSFCERLTELERTSGNITANRRYRLPTELEWKWACRAGVEGPYNFSGGKAELKKYAVFGEEQPGTVGRKEPNAFGISDTLGNVSEWCADRQARGGSFQRSARHIDVDQVMSSVSGNSELGFRPVLTP